MKMKHHFITNSKCPIFAWVSREPRLEGCSRRERRIDTNFCLGVGMGRCGMGGGRGGQSMGIRGLDGVRILDVELALVLFQGV